MKSKLKIIIPIIVAVIAIITAALTINFTSSQMSDIESLMKDGYYYLNDVGDFDEAIAIFNKIILLDPMNVDAYIGLAQAYQGKGDIDKAIDTLEKGIEKTGDQRLKDMLDELLQSYENTAEVTEITSETTSETITEITSEVTTETTFKTTETSTTASAAETTIEMNTETTTSSNIDSEVESIREQSLQILDEFLPNKKEGKPNSVKYAYNSYNDETYYYKMEYDNNGNLSKETDLIFWNQDNRIPSSANITTYEIILINQKWQPRKMSNQLFDKLSNDKYKVFNQTNIYMENGIYAEEFYDDLSELECISKDDGKYEFSSSADLIYTIYFNNNSVTEIERYLCDDRDWKTRIIYNSDTHNWEYEDDKYEYSNTVLQPYTEGLPNGIDESIFNIPSDNIEKEFTDQLDFENYKSIQ